MNKKLIATAIVAIVIVSSVGVGWVVMKNDNKSSASTVEGALEVYGNANGDYVIDSEDKGLIQKIIEQDLDWKTDYPFADANYDGVVDSSDVTYVQSIMDATGDDQVTVYHNNENPDGKYVVSTKYPIVSTLASTAQSTILMLKTIGICEEIKGVSYTTGSTSYDKYLFSDYLYLIQDEYCIYTSFAGVNVDKASNFVTNYGCTAYIYSSSSNTLSNATAVENAGIDLIQVADGISDVGNYASAALLLGFLFGTSDNNYQETVIELADWINDYYSDLQEHLESVYNGTVSQISGVASSTASKVSVKGSSYTDVIEESGLYCPLASTVSVGSTTLSYVGGTDTWLNYIDVDTLIIMRASTSGWSWFDKDYVNVPSAYADHMNNFSTLQCFLNDDCIIVSTMILPCLRSGVIAEYAYPDLFEDNWVESYITDFLMEFWGWSADDCDGLRYYLTQEDVLGN
jgi:hypothetical protein